MRPIEWSLHFTQCSMFRFTFSEEISSNWWKKHTATTATPDKTSAPTMRRIYRWGSMWGSLELPKGGAWAAEKRTALSESPQGVLESVVVQTHLLPPVHVDDMWEEEVVSLVSTAEYNGLVSVFGTQTAIEAWCKHADLPVPPLSAFGPVSK